MIFVGLGANLPGPGGRSPKASLEAALAALGGRGVVVLRRSRWWCSAPVPAGDQPWFVNAVAEVETTLDPADLLAVLHEVEAACGRVRGAPNAARTCDLDLLDYHGRIAAGGAPGAGPVLPHPRLGERLFVLRPLAELAPGWVHPVTGRTVEALIEAAPAGQRCVPLEDCRPAS